LLESVLITEGLPGYVPLHDVHATTAPEFQSALGRFLRHMHEAGVVYLDISPKNILYSAAKQQFCLLDIDKVEFHATLNEPQRIEHIAVFHSRFPLGPAFYDGYGSGLSRHAAEIDKRANVVRRACISGWSRRCLKHPHAVGTKRIGGLRWHIRLAYWDSQLENVLRNPDAADNATGFVVDCLRHHSAKKAYRRAYFRELSGERVLRPVAVAEKRVLGFAVRGYFVAKAP
jgi:hypothetical protein